MRRYQTSFNEVIRFWSSTTCSFVSFTYITSYLSFLTHSMTQSTQTQKHNKQRIIRYSHQVFLKIFALQHYIMLLHLHKILLHLHRNIASTTSFFTTHCITFSNLNAQHYKIQIFKAKHDKYEKILHYVKFFTASSIVPHSHNLRQTAANIPSKFSRYSGAKHQNKQYPGKYQSTVNQST